MQIQAYEHEVKLNKAKIQSLDQEFNKVKLEK